MSRTITYHLNKHVVGERVEWREKDKGVRVLFYKTKKGIVASLVQFNGEQYSDILAERWLRNRIAQYSLNSQIAELTPYEAALLEALVLYKPEFTELAGKWVHTPGIQNVASILNKNSELWDISKRLRAKALQVIKE
jgi:hypothetical protein